MSSYQHSFSNLPAHFLNLREKIEHLQISKVAC
jgi:hypothetical protein